TWDIRDGASNGLAGLIAGGNITIAAADSDVDATRVNVLANTDVLGTGHIDATTNGNLTLLETAGDFRIGMIQSTAGDVSLTAGDPTLVVIPVTNGPAANIYDVAGTNGTTPYVVGNSITLVARYGGVGSLTNVLEIDSSAQADGAVTISAGKSIFATETSGDLRIAGIAATQATSDVVLRTLAGSMLDAGGDTSATDQIDETDVQGSRIDLEAVGGSIGTSDNSLDIGGGGTAQQDDPTFQLNPFNELGGLAPVPAPGTTYAHAATGLYLNENNGGMRVLKAFTDAGEVRLSSVDSARQGEGILVATNGTRVDGTFISQGIVTGPGAVSLLAGDNLTIEAGALVTSTATGSSVLLSADDQTPDGDAGIGAIVDIQGDVLADTVTIQTGEDLDYIQLDNPNGINATGTTIVNAGVSDDSIFVRAVTGTLTLNGGLGADNYYIAGNASRAIFTAADGSYHEHDLGMDPLSKLSGTLAGVLEPLTINAGQGGNGGTRDQIWISAAGETSSLTGTIGASSISGFGMAAGASIDFSGPDGLALALGLGSGDDTVNVTAVDAKVALFVHGGAGNDTFNAGSDAGTLAGFSGIVGFYGDGGSNDTVNVYSGSGNDTGQLTAIAVTGLGMGTNTLPTVHNDVFGAGYAVGVPGAPTVFPSAIYFASQNTVTHATTST
ncbi:MAG TPA: hypothetical protein VIW45_11545, partial [Vicinamibacterales bacterium]